MFDGDELQRFVSQARWVTVNDYEWQLLQQTHRLERAAISRSASRR